MTVVFVPFDRSEAEAEANEEEGKEVAMHTDWWQVAIGSQEADFLKKVSTSHFCSSIQGVRLRCFTFDRWWPFFHSFVFPEI